MGVSDLGAKGGRKIRVERIPRGRRFNIQNHSLEGIETDIVLVHGGRLRRETDPSARRRRE